MNYAILFDQDETLIETATTLVADCNKAALESMRPGSSRLYTSLNTERGSHWEIYEKMGFSQDEIEELSIRYNRERLARFDMIRIYDGVTEMLDELKRDYRLGIVTNNYSYVTKEEFRKLVLLPYFSLIVGSEGGKEWAKPSPLPVLHSIKSLGSTPERTVVVGNMPVDYESAAGAGAHFIGVTYGDPAYTDNHVRLAHSPMELPGLISELFGSR